MTLRQFLWYHDSYLLASWDHTAQTSAMIHNLLSVVANALGGKNKIKPQLPNHFHPYKQEDKPKTHRVTAGTIHVLRHIGNNMVRDK